MANDSGQQYEDIELANGTHVQPRWPVRPVRPARIGNWWSAIVSKKWNHSYIYSFGNDRGANSQVQSTNAPERNTTSQSVERTINPRPRASSASPPTQGRKDFISALTGKRTTLDGPLLSACEWFCEYLKHRINIGWVSLIQPVLTIETPSELPPDSSEFDVAFQVLAVIVEKLRVPNIALSDICDELDDKHLIKGSGADRNSETQFVFAAIGWINALYIPRLEELGNEFLRINDKIADSTETQSLNSIITRPQHHNRAETVTRVYIEDCVDQPLIGLLDQLGSTLPKKLSYNSLETGQRESEFWIEGGLVNFHILHQVAQIEIDWVDTIGQHLEFDAQRKRLKLFRLLINYPTSAGWLQESQNSDPCFCFHEILVSYRILFDSPISSWARWTRIGRSQPTIPPTSDAAITSDPLLNLLCSSPPNSPQRQRIYDLIHACDVSSSYNASQHFPSLGQRLLDLQEHVKSRNVGSVRGLWHDQRSMSQWWTFWAVIWFGGAALTLGLIQVILQAVQVAMTKQQLDSEKGEV